MVLDLVPSFIVAEDGAVSHNIEARVKDPPCALGVNSLYFEGAYEVDYVVFRDGVVVLRRFVDYAVEEGERGWAHPVVVDDSAYSTRVCRCEPCEGE